MTMFGAYPEAYTCRVPIAGASVAGAAVGAHVCDAERLLDFRLFQLRDEIATFDAQLTDWLLARADRPGSPSATAARATSAVRDLE